MERLRSTHAALRVGGVTAAYDPTHAHVPTARTPWAHMSRAVRTDSDVHRMAWQYDVVIGLTLQPPLVFT